MCVMYLAILLQGRTALADCKEFKIKNQINQSINLSMYTKKVVISLNKNSLAVKNVRGQHCMIISDQSFDIR